MRRDATPPGAPTALRLDGGVLRFISPGDDLLCGRPAAYEISTGGPFKRVDAQPVTGGATAAVPLGGRPRTVSVRAVDEQGNLGRTATVRR
jgi:hypothetical protein